MGHLLQRPGLAASLAPPAVSAQSLKGKRVRLQLLRSSKDGAGEPQWRAPEGAALDTQLGPVLEETPLGTSQKSMDSPGRWGWVACLLPSRRCQLASAIDFAHLQADIFPKTQTLD